MAILADDLEREVKHKTPVLYAALAYHKNHRGHLLDLEKQPSMKALYAERRPRGCVIKSVQGGVSEWLLVKGITEAGNGRNIFWVLPDGGLVGRFVNERFNKTIEFTPEYQELVDPRKLWAFKAKTGMKQFGRGTITFVGSRSSQGFTEFVADTLIIDELDRCDQKNIAMAVDRLGFAENPSDWRISNPTITGFGIDEMYSLSTKAKWHIECGCGRYVHPDPFEVLFRQIDESTYMVRDEDYEMEGDMEPRMICPHCHGSLPRFGKGRWVEEYPRRHVVGYHFSKLFTSNATLRSVVENFNAGLSNYVRLMRCYNADFGMAFDSPGAKITAKMIDDAKGDYRMHRPEGRCIFGADVGNVIHAVVAELVPWQGKLGCRVVWAGDLHEEKDVLRKYDEYRCIAGTIDAMPEERMTRRLVRSRRGLYRAYYNRGPVDRVDQKNKIVNLSRTPALDAVKEGLVVGQMILPMDIDSVPGFYDHLQAARRIYDEDRQEFVWVEGSRPDHYHHALVYLNTTRALVLSAM